MPMLSKLLARVLCLACLIVGPMAAHAGEKVEKLAILSLVADQLTVVTYLPQAGSALNRNDELPMPLENTLLDRVALLVASEAATKRLPASRLATLAVPEPGSDFDPNGLFRNSDLVPSHPMLAPLHQGGFTHLLVVAKLRAPTRLKYVDGISAPAT